MAAAEAREEAEAEETAAAKPLRERESSVAKQLLELETWRAVLKSRSCRTWRRRRVFWAAAIDTPVAAPRHPLEKRALYKIGRPLYFNFSTFVHFHIRSLYRK